MKKQLSLALAGMMLLSVTSCATLKVTEATLEPTQSAVAVPEVTPEPAPEPAPEPTQAPVILTASDTSDLDDLHTLSTLESETIQIALLSSAQLDDDGIPMFDDNNEFAVVATVGDQDFVLFEREAIQLGMPRVSLFETLDGTTVITLSDIRTAKYDIYEYTYDETASGFTVDCLTQNDAINFMGEM